MGRKSAKIAARKGAADRAKALVYTKALFEVTKAVKIGGDDADTNFMLRVALAKCRKNNVPKDNIERAIKKGMGSDGDGYSDVIYEGYGPGGVGILVETSTNNVTRTVANVRHAFSKYGGTLGNSGSLQFLFQCKSVFELPIGDLDEDEFTLEMIDSEAEEVEIDEGTFVITGEREVFGTIFSKLESLGITPDEASLEYIPTTLKKVDEETLESNYKIIDMLEADDDVVRVFHNLDEEV